MNWARAWVRITLALWGSLSDLGMSAVEKRTGGMFLAVAWLLLLIPSIPTLQSKLNGVYDGYDHSNQSMGCERDPSILFWMVHGHHTGIHAEMYTQVCAIL